MFCSTFDVFAKASNIVNSTMPSDVQQSSRRSSLKPGEWICTDKPAPRNKSGIELGKDAAEKSKGLFSAEDWMCSKCGNVNWAKRKTCNVCNSKKHADLEERTGFGGGFNDRQNVEYVKRQDDEEYDAFGRKKKKKTHESEQLNKLGEEEEESDGDDADLDKYNFDDLEDVKIDLSVLKRKDNDKEEDSSDCSCSCSGGECSCSEEEEHEVPAKQSKRDNDRPRDYRSSPNRGRYDDRHDRTHERRRSRDRSRERRR